MKHYYAISHPYGSPMRSAESGRLIVSLHRFAARASRNEWVNAAPDFSSRETVTAAQARALEPQAFGPDNERGWERQDNDTEFFLGL